VRGWLSAGAIRPPVAHRRTLGRLPGLGPLGPALLGRAATPGLSVATEKLRDAASAPLAPRGDRLRAWRREIDKGQRTGGRSRLAIKTASAAGDGDQGAWLVLPLSGDPADGLDIWSFRLGVPPQPSPAGDVLRVGLRALADTPSGRWTACHGPSGPSPVMLKPGGDAFRR